MIKHEDHTMDIEIYCDDPSHIAPLEVVGSETTFPADPSRQEIKHIVVKCCPACRGAAVRYGLGVAIGMEIGANCLQPGQREARPIRTHWKKRVADRRAGQHLRR